MKAKAKEAESTPGERINTLAHECLKQADGRCEGARRIFVQKLQRDRALYRSVVATLIDQAAHEAIELAMRRSRLAIIDAATPGPQARGDLGLVVTAVRSMMDYPLRGGLPMRKATREDVVEQSELHRGNVLSNLAKQLWLERIAKEMPEGSTVGDVLREEQLVSMWQDVDAEVKQMDAPSSPKT